MTEFNKRPAGITQEELDAARRAQESALEEVAGFSTYLDQSTNTEKWKCPVCGAKNACAASTCNACNQSTRPKSNFDLNLEGTQGHQRMKPPVRKKHRYDTVK